MAPLARTKKVHFSRLEQERTSGFVGKTWETVCIKVYGKVAFFVLILSIADSIVPKESPFGGLCDQCSKVFMRLGLGRTLKGSMAPSTRVWLSTPSQIRDWI